MIQEERKPIISNIIVDRSEKRAVEICWETELPDLDVSIYMGHSPNFIDRTSPAAKARGQTCVRISGLEQDARHYFEVVPEGGPGVMTAERKVPMSGAVNFRDLGGYKASDGRWLKWGQIFRSDNLSRLTDGDQALFRGLGIKIICDFRTPSEVKRSPDRLPDKDSTEYLHLPIVHGEFDFIAALERIKKGDDDWLTEDFMVKGYLRNVDDFPEIWGTVLNRLANRNNRPLLFHCTGGKDRAGTCAALILLALGIPEETVIYDHQLSNVFIAPMFKKVYEKIESYGVDPEKVAPYFTAPKECIVILLDHIRENYSSAESYLRTRAGVSEETLALLKQELLE